MFKNLNQLKNNIEVGQEVRVKNYLKNKDENRIVIKKQTNGISTGVEISKEEYQEKCQDMIKRNHVIEVNGRYYEKTFLEYEKASHMQFNGNTVEFLAYVYESHNNIVVVPSLDFEVGDTWLSLVF